MARILFAPSLLLLAIFVKEAWTFQYDKKEADPSQKETLIQGLLLERKNNGQVRSDVKGIWNPWGEWSPWSDPSIQVKNQRRTKALDPDANEKAQRVEKDISCPCRPWRPWGIWCPCPLVMAKKQRRTNALDPDESEKAQVDVKDIWTPWGAWSSWSGPWFPVKNPWRVKASDPGANDKEKLVQYKGDTIDGTIEANADIFVTTYDVATEQGDASVVDDYLTFTRIFHPPDLDLCIAAPMVTKRRFESGTEFVAFQIENRPLTTIRVRADIAALPLSENENLCEAALELCKDVPVYQGQITSSLDDGEAKDWHIHVHIGR